VSEPLYTIAGAGPAAAHATSLLAAVGARVTRVDGPPEPPPAVAWADSGAMALTGWPAVAPRIGPAAVAVAMRGAAIALDAAAARRGAALRVDGPSLLGERAACAGLARGGRIAPGRASRLLGTRDGWIALSLARPDDVDLLPAWLEEAPARFTAADPWPAVGLAVAERPAAALVARGRLLGLPVSRVAPAPRCSVPPLRIGARGPRIARRPGTPVRVLDLSALWAGPLCGGLLVCAGAEVLKIESRARPDGARAGPAAFYDRLNAGKSSLALELERPRDRALLLRLLDAADVVIESARPRALRQLGIDAEAQVRARPGLTWVALSGYGREGPGADWVAFGDDAGAAAGLGALAGDGSEAPLVCADAVADPLAGLHAAAAALAAHEAGGGVLIDVSLVGVATSAAACAPRPDPRAVAVLGSPGAWRVVGDSWEVPVRPPRARPARGVARPLGADPAGIDGWRFGAAAGPGSPAPGPPVRGA
jgi:hypothetical protein